MRSPLPAERRTLRPAPAELCDARHYPCDSAPRMPLRCVYTDLDGTLLGRGASLLRDGDGGFTLLPARALEACFRAGAEVVPVSGRRRTTLFEDARLLGLSSYVYEVGGGMVVDGEDTPLTGDLRPSAGRTVHDLIADSGAPRLL